MNRQSRRMRGASLVEGLVAIVLLAVGLLGLARFQAEQFRQSADAQSRLAAAGLADALLAYARVDPANAACYTRPRAGLCASPAAAALADDWAAEAASRGFGSVSATLVAPSRLTARLAWTSHAFHATRSLEATTDVRP